MWLLHRPMTALWRTCPNKHWLLMHIFQWHSSNLCEVSWSKVGEVVVCHSVHSICWNGCEDCEFCSDGQLYSSLQEFTTTCWTRSTETISFSVSVNEVIRSLKSPIIGVAYDSPKPTCHGSKNESQISLCLLRFRRIVWCLQLIWPSLI